MVDIMIKEEDAGKMNRIAERFNFKDVATIKKESNSWTFTLKVVFFQLILAYLAAVTIFQVGSLL